MKASQLKQMISTIVSEELRKQLPSLIERVLTEKYIRRVVNESRAPTTTDFEEEIPEPQDSDHDGIYHEDQPNVLRRQNTNEALSKLLGKNSDLAFLYEGTSPIPAATVSPTGPDVSLKELGKLGLDLDVDRMRKLAKIAAPAPTAPVKEAPRRYRPELDQVVDTRRDPSEPVQRRQPSRLLSVSDDSGFPDKPVTFDD